MALCQSLGSLHWSRWKYLSPAVFRWLTVKFGAEGDKATRFLFSNYKTHNISGGVWNTWNINWTTSILLGSEWLAWWYSDFSSSKETCLTSTCCHCGENGKRTLLFSGLERAIWVSLLITKPGLNFKLTKSEGHQKLCPVNSSSIVSRQFWWKGFSKGWKHQTLFVYIETFTAFIVFVCKISLYRKS